MGQLRGAFSRLPANISSLYFSNEAFTFGGSPQLFLTPVTINTQRMNYILPPLRNSCRAPVDHKLLGTESCSHQCQTPQRMIAQPLHSSHTFSACKVRIIPDSSCRRRRRGRRPPRVGHSASPGRWRLSPSRSRCWWTRPRRQSKSKPEKETLTRTEDEILASKRMQITWVNE